MRTGGESMCRSTAVAMKSPTGTVPAGTAPGAVRCGKLLDVRTGRMLVDQIISFDAGGVITAVRPAGSAPADPATVDLGNLVCLPGLIDVHVHLTANPGDESYEGLAISVPREAITGVRNARRTVNAGFTTVRNVGASGYSDVALRDAINDGDVVGPRMLVSGPPLSITGGHADNNLLPYAYRRIADGIADGPWEVRAKVREVAKYGADLIKIMASGGVVSKNNHPGTAQYTLEELRAITEEGHKLGRKVASHAHGTQSIKDSILAGVDSVEHASLIDDEGLSLAKERGTYLIFDIYNDDYIVEQGAAIGMFPESMEKARFVGRTQRENFRRAVTAGIKMAFGSDGGVYPHGDNAKQFVKMVEWGMTPLAAIRAATLDAADLIGWPTKVGALEPGYFADLVAVGGDPIADLSILQSIKVVLKGGDVVRDERPASAPRR